MRFFFYDDFFSLTKSFFWLSIGILCSWIFVQFALEYFLFNFTDDMQKQNSHSFNVSRGFVITMNEADSRELLPDIKTYMEIDTIFIFPAINGSRAMQRDHHKLPLYTRYTMLMGRHDHMQIANPAALGCLLSHIEIWKQMLPGEIIAIFEEDAYFNKDSTRRFRSLSQDMSSNPWDIIMLINGQFIATGSWKSVGNSAMTCDTLNSSISPMHLCTWFGTRGYILTYKGSRHLLNHAFPIQIQIDALIALVAAFEPNFKMFWVRDNIVHQRLFYKTQIWDACLKCYLPTDLWFYVLCCICFIWFLIYSIIRFKKAIHTFNYQS